MIAVGQSPGRARTEILDENDEVHPYTIEVADPIWDDIAFRVVRLDATKDGDYRTARNLAGKWRCNCADSIYRGRQRACKHVKHLRELTAIVEALCPPRVTITLGEYSVVNKSESIVNLAKALVAAQTELKNPPLDAVNPHFRNRYASLAGVRDTITPVFARHGLAIIQNAGSGDRGPRITTMIIHSSGEWLETDALEVPASKQDAQGYGSALTYGRRYALQSIANVVGDDDDDGEAARKAQAATPRPATKPAAAPPPATTQVMAKRFLELVSELQLDRNEARQRLIDAYHPTGCEKVLELGTVFLNLAPSQAQDALDKLERSLLARKTAKQTA